MVHIAIKISFPVAPLHPQISVLALARLTLLVSSPRLSPKAVSSFQCDRTMMSFGRICQDRPTDAWQCCKMTLFEAFLLTYHHQEPNIGEMLTPDFKKENAHLRKRKGLFSLIVVGSLESSCNHV